MLLAAVLQLCSYNSEKRINQELDTVCTTDSMHVAHTDHSVSL